MPEESPVLLNNSPCQETAPNGGSLQICRTCQKRALTVSGALLVSGSRGITCLIAEVHQDTPPEASTYIWSKHITKGNKLVVMRSLQKLTQTYRQGSKLLPIGGGRGVLALLLGLAIFNNFTNLDHISIHARYHFTLCVSRPACTRLVVFSPCFG